MEDKKDIRKNYYYHPQYGVVTKGIDGSFYHEDGNAYVAEGYELETLYQRDRRLWVEQMVVTDLAGQNDIVNSEDFKCMIKYYFDTYDLIQNELSNFQTNK
jgi:hypothetical protein